MALAAFAFGGGYAIRNQFENLQLPQFRGRQGEGLCFKISVRIISASVPALGPPGVWSRQRPRLEIGLGETRKDTELADYAADDNTSGLDNARECPWRFGETLTFVCRLDDVLSHGFRFCLKAHSDFQLGPVQFQFSQLTDLGEASVDIRQRALPACIGHRHRKGGNWDSPVLVIPLSHVKGGKCSADHGIGEAVAHVTLMFSVDTDPEEVLAAADAETRGVAGVLGVADVMNWMEKPWDAGWLAPSSQVDLDSMDSTEGLFLSVKKAGNGEVPLGDLAPDGWISHVAPNGRKFWHHRALGPAPWEAKAAGSLPPPPATPLAPVTPKQCGHMSSTSPRPVRQHDTRGISFGSPRPNVADQLVGAALGQERPQTAREDGASTSRHHTGAQKQGVHKCRRKPKSIVNGPDQDPSAWVSHQGPDGRVFWHHLALGPPPWERDSHAQVKRKPGQHDGIAPSFSPRVQIAPSSAARATI